MKTNEELIERLKAARHEHKDSCRSLRRLLGQCDCGASIKNTAIDEAIAALSAKQKPADEQPVAYSDDELEACVEWLQGEELTVNVGNVTGEGDELLESSAGLCLRVIKSLKPDAEQQPPADEEEKMSMKLTWHVFQEMIDGNLKYLEKQCPPSLERGHIMQIVAHAPDMYYPEKPADEQLLTHAWRILATPDGADDRTRLGPMIRAFWRRIYPYRNDYAKELPDPLPVAFVASMATAMYALQQPPADMVMVRRDDLFHLIEWYASGEGSLEMDDYYHARVYRVNQALSNSAKREG